MAFDWGTVFGAGFGGAALYGITQIVKAVLQRKTTNADAAAKLAQSANSIIETVRNDAERSIEAAGEQVKIARAELVQAREESRKEVNQARMEAAEARREAAQAQREATEARRSSDESLYLMRRLTAAILSPYATIEQLREMVSVNGTRMSKPSE
jgi:hypothetical protein